MHRRHPAGRRPREGRLRRTRSGLLSTLLASATPKARRREGDEPVMRKLDRDAKKNLY